MPHKAKPEHEQILELVVTRAEACRITNRSPKVIQYAIDAHNIAARKVGGTWLVSIDSLLLNFPLDRPKKTVNKSG